MKSLTFQIDFWLSLFLHDEASYFWMSWWIVIFEIKSWSKSQSLTFCESVDQISTINTLILRNVLNYEIRPACCIWILDIMLQSIRSCIRSKVTDQSITIKSIILTILPFWWSDQISWGVVLQTWSNDSYESIMLMWIKNYEVWL